MNYLNKVNWDTLNKYILDGWITANKHPEYDIWILNYTPKTQAKKYWDLYTLSCRGLVINANGDIIARPFQKFKNLEEHDPSEIDMNQKYEIFEKMDGSLIILFYYFDKMEWIVASRNSFISEQSITAKKMINKSTYDVLDNNKTYLFEVIYPENRIVVNYGNINDIVLLGVVDTKTGDELCYGGMMKKYSNHFTIVKKYAITNVTDLSELRKYEQENHEGFVVKFKNGFRVKVKFKEYVRLHGILTNVSNITIWEHLMNGYNFDELLDMVPDEFYQWVTITANNLKNNYIDVERNALKEFINVYYYKGMTNRKDFAMSVINSKYRGILFNIYDVKKYSDIIWKMIKPAYSKPFRDGYNIF